METKTPALVVMAAGLGSRFGSLKQIESVTLQHERIIDFSIYDAIRAGFKRVIFIISPDMEPAFRQVIGDCLAKSIEVEYAHQRLDDVPAGCVVPQDRSKPYGTGHAILAARHLIHEPFAVINADDYYGPQAFVFIYTHLSALGRGETTDDVMVSYLLGNTVSEHGSVSRGVCQIDKNGHLASVVERSKIARQGADLAYFDDKAQTWEKIAADTKVSMNAWGFAPEFLKVLAAEFAAFWEGQMKADPLKAEFFLNAVVNQGIQSGSSRVKVLSTPDLWHGMTYPEDKALIAEAMQAMKDKGLYPEKLWPACAQEEVS
ncbi:MAG: nucleotidyltransferase [Clostridia bacterium]|nr:nucleotidyltransferase [Clostridia bacterium]NCC75935.1 nucleotidyltransferase [Clostridia bacterium]